MLVNKQRAMEKTKNTLYLKLIKKILMNIKIE